MLGHLTVNEQVAANLRVSYNRTDLVGDGFKSTLQSRHIVDVDACEEACVAVVKKLHMFDDVVVGEKKPVTMNSLHALVDHGSKWKIVDVWIGI